MAERRIAISYSRFSDPKQAAGDSTERQERDFRNFCRRHNLTPLGEIYADRGRSGYKGHHRTKGELGKLIQAAKDGRFEPSTVIVVEAWDRLGRLRPDKQTELIAELLRTGVNIGICRLDDIFTESDFGSHKWAGLSMFVMLAHQESKQKSDRGASVWKKWRERARLEGRLMNCRLPAWLKVVNGIAVPIPERVAAVKRIFHLSADGYGHARIVKQLIADKVPPFGGGNPSKLGVRWTLTYVSKLLNDERVCGRLQPRLEDGTPDGPALESYYPAIVTPEAFSLARAGQTGRRGRGGKRDSKYCNVFQTFLLSATDGEPFILANRGLSADKPDLILRNSAGMGGRAAYCSFPYPVFEKAILGQLWEINAQDVLPRESTPSKAEVLRASLANIRADIAGLQEELKNGFSRALAAVLRDKEAEEEKVAGQLQDELAASVRPTERAWSEFHSLNGLIEKYGDEARLKIRTVLRSIVQDARLLLVRRGSRILAGVQIFFTGGAVRHYLIVYQAACRHKPQKWWPLDFKSTGMKDLPDLRDPDHVRRVEAALEKLDLGSVQ